MSWPFAYLILLLVIGFGYCVWRDYKRMRRGVNRPIGNNAKMYDYQRKKLYRDFCRRSNDKCRLLENFE